MTPLRFQTAQKNSASFPSSVLYGSLKTEWPHTVLITEQCTPFYLHLEINLNFQCSKKVSQTKTNLKPDYSCFVARRFWRSWNTVFELQMWTERKIFFHPILLVSPICACSMRKILLATGERCEWKSGLKLLTFSFHHREAFSIFSDKSVVWSSSKDSSSFRNPESGGQPNSMWQYQVISSLGNPHKLCRPSSLVLLSM